MMTVVREPPLVALAKAVDSSIKMVDCALKQPVIPPGKHIFVTHLKDVVPAVLELYPSIFWLYNQVGESDPFREPVNAIRDLAFDYFDVVANPMSLRDVLDRIVSGEYSSPEQVLSDVEQIWTNCRLFNGEASPYTAKATACKQKLADEIATRRDNAIAAPKDQDGVVTLIQDASDDQLNEKILEMLERVAPASVKDGELDVSRLTVRACREIRILVQKFTDGTLAGVKRPRAS